MMATSAAKKPAVVTISRVRISIRRSFPQIARALASGPGARRPRRGSANAVATPAEVGVGGELEDRGGGGTCAWTRKGSRGGVDPDRETARFDLQRRWLLLRPKRVG